MSKVRVSNGSPTLERVDARQADHAKLPVCRNLFGPVDREEFERDVREQMLEIEKASKEKWNYDFAKNEPLAPGDYEWQEVDADEMPEFYTRPPRVKRDTSSGTVDHNGNHDCLLTTPSRESARGDSDNAEPGSRSDCRTALTTPRKRPSTEEQGKCLASSPAIRSVGGQTLCPSDRAVVLRLYAKPQTARFSNTIFVLPIDLPCQSKRPNVQATEANCCPDASSHDYAPSKSNPKT
ncbi:cyclin-dependent kinase inhibitor 1B-like protein [Labeo rohita]|uniref:Cyclin-dependent kinase inhibitor 1B n=1 Tax=Labeo rohita TaxID=84645 RepID=A0A498MNQ2_LABRO|nr:cyclin-dependent kinase inhibitor 1B-like protein [Labeo rohita]